MLLTTPHFGTISIEETGIITFPAGIPGFENCRRFVLLQRPEEAPVAWLQGVEDPNLAFAVAEPHLFLDSYKPHLSADELEILELGSEDGALTLNILVLSPDPAQITANLQAPVLINQEKRLGLQAYLGEEWPRKYYLFPSRGKKKVVNG